MQEDIENRSIALILNTGRFTARTLGRACMWLLHQMKQNRGEMQECFKPEKNSVKELMKKGDAPSLPFDGDTKLFDRFARKHKVKYEFRKLEKGKYLLFFKASQTDAITSCLSSYAKYVMGRGKGRSIVAELAKGAERVRATAPPERDRTREAGRDGR